MNQVATYPAKAITGNYFSGKLSKFQNRDEEQREKKHAKAFLKGHNFYRHGFDSITGAPKYHVVKRSDKRVL